MSREEEYLAKRVERLERELEMANKKIGYWRAGAIGVAKSLAWTADEERVLEGSLDSATRRTG
ncbi:MAG TPA: hypothetical protein VFN70_18335 [Burkholderiales bacterium]|nr:hypothetical protein [Burkholderiales bacterium]